MGELFDVQPTPTHSDYLERGAGPAAPAAQSARSSSSSRTFATRTRASSARRCAAALAPSRHDGQPARRRRARARSTQPLRSHESAIEVASAHLYEQARRDAFNRIAARDALMVDAEPQRLGIELVNRYHAVKRAGLI